jgi:predicted nucleic-acid-binding Zn-ribbon protein
MTDHLDDITGDGCPKCGSQSVNPVKYTWWGGLIGPKLFHHTKCKDCGYTYNSKTKNSNTPAIIIYSVLLFIVAFAIFYGLRR